MRTFRSKAVEEKFYEWRKQYLNMLKTLGTAPEKMAEAKIAEQRAWEAYLRECDRA